MTQIYQKFTPKNIKIIKLIIFFHEIAKKMPHLIEIKDGMSSKIIN